MKEVVADESPYRHRKWTSSNMPIPAQRPTHDRHKLKQVLDQRTGAEQYQYAGSNPIASSDPSGLMTDYGASGGVVPQTSDERHFAPIKYDTQNYTTYDSWDTGDPVSETLYDYTYSTDFKVKHEAEAPAYKTLQIQTAYEHAHPERFSDPEQGAAIVDFLVGEFTGCAKGEVSSCLIAAGEIATAGAGKLAVAGGKGAALTFKAVRAERKVGDALVAAADTAARACSFSGATLVLMADGSKKPIDQVKVGEMVLATDPETGEQKPRKVEHVFVHDDALTDLQLADGTVLITTEDHPYWSVDDRRFERADELSQGERVLSADSRTIRVSSLQLETTREGLAYNLAVEGIHTYHVGDDAILVHNTCSVRAIWKITDEQSLATRVVGSHKYSKQADGTWWSRDTAGHGGSSWKVYRETSKGLEWYRDADKYGDYIDPALKHKSDAGMIVRW
ncbi:polymorphic toxin-type HINT domain-containing protein [Nocardioides acrostichi]|uniref:polymorphic toxin-type HINT domain-containing protein n=1 Tax=Nocardioides acrostichi TaxID=2784339 RepID=UPI001A9C5B7A|nr:polymorphic toxin-type HINT domain-containing protein [Nocardioides acrostichi]